MTVHLLSLLVVWVALWGEVSVANVVSGVVVAVLVTTLFRSGSAGGHRLRPIGALRLGASVFADLVVSTWRVVVAVLRPTPDRVHAEVIEVSLRSRSPLVCTLVANAITLTPGTMTVDLDPQSSRLRVHVLGRVDHDEFRASVRALEDRVLAAVGNGPVHTADGRPGVPS